MAQSVGLSRARAQRLALLALVCIGMGVIWATPRPLMIDLPQHAAQVALLRDLVLGRSPWAADIQVNLATPYLIGYGLALPLALIMPVAVALKVVLSLAYAGFVAVCVAIGRELGASARLDSYYAFSFFGFAYAWGMYTFLVAAPVGLCFLWLSLRYAREGARGQGLALTALGVALLFSHGLVFLFSAGVGALLLLVRARGMRDLAARSWPYWLMLCACAGLFLHAQHRESTITPGFGSAVLFGSWKAHLVSLLFNAFDAPTHPWPAAWLPVFVGLPLLSALRPDIRRREAFVILLAVVAAVLVAPAYAWSTSLLFPRFALFLPAACVWLLAENVPVSGSLASWIQPRLRLLAGLVCGAVLIQHAALQVAFGREQADFSKVLAAAAPGQRALALIFDPSSRVDRSADAYQHFALWYQAERHGFVDFNFASFHPQIARFRIGREPPIDERLAQYPQSFDWRLHGGDRYRYFFVRVEGELPAATFAAAPCSPILIERAGEWRLFERGACR